MPALAGELVDLPGNLVDRLLLPGSVGYESARKPWDPRHAGSRPAAVAYCRTSTEVSAVVRWADRLGLRVTPGAAATASPAAPRRATWWWT